MRGSQFKIFASLVSGNICFINLASPNKDKIRDFELFYQPPYHDTIVYSQTSIFINTLKLLNVETIEILTLIVRV